MNDDVLIKYADCVDEDVIEKYFLFEKKLIITQKAWKIKYFKIAAISACIVLLVMGGFFGIVNDFLKGSVTNNTESLYIIKAYATNGELVEIDPYEGTYNSGYTGENLFGVDFPIFSFDVIPTALAEGKLIGFDIEVSVICDDKYNEKEHIAVSYLFLRGGNGTLMGYNILGWFEEPTDITVVLTDKKTQKIIEEITINICYCDDKEAYKLTVIETKTH